MGWGGRLMDTVRDYAARRGDWIVVEKTSLSYRREADDVAMRTDVRWRLARAVRVRRDGKVTHHCRPSSYAWAKPTGSFSVEASERVRTVPALARERARMEAMGDAEWASLDECKADLLAERKAKEAAARLRAEMADSDELRERIWTCRLNGRGRACSLKARHVRALVREGPLWLGRGLPRRAFWRARAAAERGRGMRLSSCEVGALVLPPRAAS